MDDDAFLAAFRAGGIAPAHFDHRAHLRAASCALARLPFLEACIVMRDGLRRIAERANKPGLYHETMTVAFVALIADARDADPDEAVDVDRLIARHPQLLDRGLVGRHYRDDTLRSDAARRRFRMPDAPPR